MERVDFTVNDAYLVAGLGAVARGAPGTGNIRCKAGTSLLK